MGNSIEGSGSYVQNVQQCTTQTFYENRTVAYNVIYEYAGKEHTVQLPYDPGADHPAGADTDGGHHPACAAEAPDSRAPGTAMGVIVGTPPAQPLMAAPPVAYTTYYPAYHTRHTHTRLIPPTTRVRTSTRRSACR